MKNRIRPVRARFKGDAACTALAMDPGGSGIIAGLRSGKQPQPGAFGWFDTSELAFFDAESVEDGVAILSFSGPLEHHAHWYWQSYEALSCEVERALLDAQVKKVILKGDSPGGVAAGMGEAHKHLRSMIKKYGKDVYFYADQMACSAAYNLASACTEVWTSEEGVLGSIGVILCTIDETKRLEKEGTAVRYVVSGKRKADLHPGQPVSDDVIDVAQGKVDALAKMFFKAVGRARGMGWRDVRDLEAAVFMGEDAKRAGLCDGIASWPKFLRLVKRSVATQR